MSACARRLFYLMAMRKHGQAVPSLDLTICRAFLFVAACGDGGGEAALPTGDLTSGSDVADAMLLRTELSVCQVLLPATQCIAC